MCLCACVCVCVFMCVCECVSDERVCSECVCEYVSVCVCVSECMYVWMDVLACDVNRFRVVSVIDPFQHIVEPPGYHM